MCPHGYHHNGFMETPALGTQEVRFIYIYIFPPVLYVLFLDMTVYRFHASTTLHNTHFQLERI